MKLALRISLLGLLLLMPVSVAYAQAPSITNLSNMTVNAGATQTVNVVAVDPNNDAITLTETLPAFVTLNAPTTGTGSVSTTLTVSPTAGDVGTHTGSVIATAGGEVDSTTFTITVAAAGSNQAPLVVSPATVTGTEETNVTFTVSASDADADPITSLAATGLPSGATFTPNGTFTAGVFSWTPTSTQSGGYDVTFTAMSGTLTGVSTTHIQIADAAQVSVSDISDKTVTAGGTMTVNVNVTGPTSGTTTLTASLPSWATLNPPTSSTGTGTLATTITLAPPAGTTGTFAASVTATNGSATDTETFTITVTAPQSEVAIAPINDRSMTAGTTSTVNISVTGPTSGTISLSANAPSWATLNPPTTSTGSGTLYTTLTLAPPAGTTGTFDFTLTATNGGLSDTETFSVTVTASGGGGDMTATAKMLGAFNKHRKFICFRIEPMNGSFDVRNVNLAGITLAYNGTVINAMAGKTHVDLECGDDDNEGDDCDECDGDDDHEDCDSTNVSGDCVASLHACFSMTDLLALFGDANLPSSFMNATLTGTLTTGGTFTATMDSRFAGNPDKEDHGHGKLNARVRPNPLNPSTKLTFTMAQAGKVRVVIYDLQGRLVRTLLDENRAAGEQSVTWDGSSDRKGRVSSGVYFFRLETSQGHEVQRVTVLK